MTGAPFSTTNLEYRRKLTTPQQAAELVKSGDTIVWGLAHAEPPALLQAVSERLRSGDLKDLKAYYLNPMEYSAATVLAPDVCDCITGHSWFVAGADRQQVRAGIHYFVPNYFHQVPRFCREYLNINVTMTTVSPMDSSGYFSFGTANDYTSTAARYCKTLMVEVNRHMPRVFGDSLLHISEVIAIVENDLPLIESPPPELQPEDTTIGHLISEFIPDGATLQLGIGGLPNAVALSLMDRRDLGIHTEVFGEAMADLIEAGVVTGKRKTIHPRKSIFTAARGTRRLYDFLNDNPGIESYPVDYTNDPSVVARNDNMISINAALEVDLLGQCNAEFLGGAQFSGTGGQLDFVRGAYMSRGGKSFIATYSTARDGSVSRVVPRLQTGAVVTTPRMDVHYLATEYGCVNLKGKSTRERALDIISIAHPKYRDSLLREAEDMRLL